MDDHSNTLWCPTIVDSLARWRELRPDAVAYTFIVDKGAKEGEITFRELHRQVMAYAAELHARRLAGEPVLIMLPSGIDYVIAFLACLASGAIAVPLYPPMNERDWYRMRAVAGNCRPKAAILNRSTASRFGGEIAAKLPENECARLFVEERSRSEGDTPVPVALDPKRLAFLQYTSGSTGDPKGVMVSHENIMHNEYQLAMALRNDSSTVVVSWLPFYHDMGLIGNILHSMAIGGHGVLMSPYTFLRNPLTWLSAISRYRGRHAGAPNFAFDLCVDKIKDEDIDTLDLSSWRAAYNGAEPIKASTLERFSRRFERAGFRRDALFPCYGLAESTLFVAGGPFNGDPVLLTVDRAKLSAGTVVPAVGNGDPDAVYTAVSVDRPFDDQIVRIVDPETWTVVPEGQVGEIWLKSRSIAQGYWNRPKETAETFRAYTTDAGEGPFLRTGDLGFFRDGRLYIAGRIKETIIVNGVNHYPQDIEDTVQSLSGNFRVHAGAAFGYDDDKLAVVQALNRPKVKRSELDSLIGQIRQAVLQVHGVAPSYVALVSPHEVPKTSSGKIQRGLVKRRFLSGELSVLCDWRGEAYSHDPLLEAAPASEESARDAGTNAVVEQKIAWLREYINHRVSSFLIDERRTIPPYVVLDFGNQGLLGMQVPAEYGGLGFSNRDFLRVMEVLGSKDLTLALFVGLNNVLGVRPVLNYATPEIKARYLPVLVSGRELAAFALTEPGAGSNPQAIETLARPTGAGSYRLRGTKYWSGSAAWCGLMNVYAKTLDADGRTIGVTAFTVPQTSPGLRQGPEALTMGMRGMIQNTVFLEDVEVPETHILGKPGHGMTVAQDAMCYGRLTIAAVCLGATKFCYQTMLRYAGERNIATGRLLENPYTGFVLTETMHAIAAIEALAYAVAERLDQGEPVRPELLAVCKSLSTEWLWKTVDRTMQLAGGRGYIESNFIAQLFRDARVFRIFEGPTETLNHFVGSAAIKSRATVRAQLLALLDEAAVREHFDAVFDRLEVPPAGDGAAAHWQYLAAGEYVNELFLYGGGCRAGIAPETRAWALERLRAARRDLESALRRRQDILPVEALRAFGDAIDRRVGRREQHYPMPQTVPDPLLTLDQRSGEASPATAAAAATDNAPPRQAVTAAPVTLAPAPVRAPAPAAPATAAASPAHTGAAARRSNGSQDVQAFLRTWVAQRCRRSVESVGVDIEFATLGLGSVDAVELSTDLSERYGVDLDPTVMWSYPNIKALAGFVRTELGARERSGGVLV